MSPFISVVSSIIPTRKDYDITAKGDNRLKTIELLKKVVVVRLKLVSEGV